jgi:hypothetical protein
MRTQICHALLIGAALCSAFLAPCPGSGKYATRTMHSSRWQLKAGGADSISGGKEEKKAKKILRKSPVKKTDEGVVPAKKNTEPTVEDFDLKAFEGCV